MDLLPVPSRLHQLDLFERWMSELPSGQVHVDIVDGADRGSRLSLVAAYAAHARAIGCQILPVVITGQLLTTKQVVAAVARAMVSVHLLDAATVASADPERLRTLVQARIYDAPGGVLMIAYGDDSWEFDFLIRDLVSLVASPEAPASAVPGPRVLVLEGRFSRRLAGLSGWGEIVSRIRFDPVTGLGRTDVATMVIRELAAMGLPISEPAARAVAAGIAISPQEERAVEWLHLDSASEEERQAAFQRSGVRDSSLRGLSDARVREQALVAANRIAATMAAVLEVGDLLPRVTHGMSGLGWAIVAKVRDGPSTIDDLANALAVEPARVVGAVQRLRRRGWLDQPNTPADERQVFATPGAGAIQQVVRAYRLAVQRAWTPEAMLAILAAAWPAAGEDPKLPILLAEGLAPGGSTEPSAEVAELVRTAADLGLWRPPVPKLILDRHVWDILVKLRQGPRPVAEALTPVPPEAHWRLSEALFQARLVAGLTTPWLTLTGAAEAFVDAVIAAHQATGPVRSSLAGSVLRKSLTSVIDMRVIARDFATGPARPGRNNPLSPWSRQTLREGQTRVDQIGSLESPGAQRSTSHRVVDLPGLITAATTLVVDLVAAGGEIPPVPPPHPDLDALLRPTAHTPTTAAQRLALPHTLTGGDLAVLGTDTATIAGLTTREPANSAESRLLADALRIAARRVREMTSVAATMVDLRFTDLYAAAGLAGWDEATVRAFIEDRPAPRACLDEPVEVALSLISADVFDRLATMTERALTAFGVSDLMVPEEGLVRAGVWRADLRRMWALDPRNVTMRRGAMQAAVGDRTRSAVAVLDRPGVTSPAASPARLGEPAPMQWLREAANPVWRPTPGRLVREGEAVARAIEGMIEQALGDLRARHPVRLLPPPWTFARPWSDVELVAVTRVMEFEAGERPLPPRPQPPGGSPPQPPGGSPPHLG